MPACARPGTYVPRQTHDCDAVLVRRHLPGFLARLEESRARSARRQPGDGRATAPAGRSLRPRYCASLRPTRRAPAGTCRRAQPRRSTALAPTIASMRVLHTETHLARDKKVR